MEHVDYAIEASQPVMGAPARPPVASFVVEDDSAPEFSFRDRLFSAPGAAFHVACGLGALGIVWSASSPAGLDLTGDPFAWLGLACALIWAIRLFLAVSRRTATAAFLVVPVVGVLLGAAVYFEVPQEARWMQAQDGFENSLRSLPQGKAWDQAVANEAVPGRIGSYWIDSVSRDSAGMVQFHLDRTLGGLLGPAEKTAFTYLVDGPTAAVRNANPGMSFEHLHGNWYAVSR